tara:strand:- start:252 stop:431 length:180 start_codon:yes stop_codon:yes gene_type:complete
LKQVGNNFHQNQFQQQQQQQDNLMTNNTDIFETLIALVALAFAAPFAGVGIYATIFSFL